MAFKENTVVELELDSGEVLEGRPFNTIYVPIKDGEEENIIIGRAITIGADGEIVPFDGANVGGIVVGSIANDVNKGYTAEICTTGYVTVDKVAGENFKFGNGVVFDSDGKAKLGPATPEMGNCVFIEEKREDETVLISINKF